MIAYVSAKNNPDIQKALNSFLKVFRIAKAKADNIAQRHGIHVGEAHVKTLGEELKAHLLRIRINRSKDSPHILYF
ncbi:MAG: hypothetical protein HY097_09120 [Nitrospinae bacterium]|nr:hypothetical protein [Nitrospinota bacterium]MBI3814337.1 hypothetical protein [Nitrospinota bacterium]